MNRIVSKQQHEHKCLVKLLIDSKISQKVKHPACEDVKWSCTNRIKQSHHCEEAASENREPMKKQGDGVPNKVSGVTSD